MANLLSQTKEAIKNSKHSIEDIEFINIGKPSGRYSYEGDDDYLAPYSTDWNGFLTYSSKFNSYDDGFG